MINKFFDRTLQDLELYIFDKTVKLYRIDSWYEEEEPYVIGSISYEGSILGAWKCDFNSIKLLETYKNSSILNINWNCNGELAVGILEKKKQDKIFFLTLKKDKPKIKNNIKKVKDNIKLNISKIPEKPKGSYVYLHCLKGTKTPFYIGKGSGERYKNKSRNKACNRVWEYNECEVIIKKDNLTSQEALDYESYLIKKYSSKGIVLTNLMD